MSLTLFQNDIGYGYRGENLLIFFGNTRGSAGALEKEFPGLRFHRLRQTHSDIVVESGADSADTEADAHFTGETNLALRISTADCMPVMVHCRETGRVAAVHAGWRGVENKITEKTLRRLIETGSRARDFRLWVGPHIRQNSFETGEDAFQLLARAHYGLSTGDFSRAVNGKHYVDLSRILASQVAHVLGKEPEIIFSSIDTKTNAGYFSYRRDQQTKERNLSFIARL